MTPANAAILETAAAPPAPPILCFEAIHPGGADAVGGRVSFAVTPGAMVGIDGGPTGDISRLMRIAALRSPPPTNGVVWLDGHDARALNRREAATWRARVGYLDASGAALDHLTVFDNAALPRRLAGESPADYLRPVEELLRWVGLWRRAGERPVALSLAEQRRLSLAMALSRGPDLLIADRPDDDLDDFGRATVLRLLRETHRAGAAVLVSCRAEALAQLAPDLVMRLDCVAR